MRYKGWYVYEDNAAPITGRWKALRSGVRTGHNTRDGLLNMIDRRTADEDDTLLERLHA